MVSMVLRLFFLLMWCGIYIRSENESYYLEEVFNKEWTDARADCGKMAFIDGTLSQEDLSACLKGISTVYVGNVKLITPPLKLLGCFPLENEYKHLMNASVQMPVAAVAFCNFMCAKSNGNFAIQGSKCRCFENDEGYVKPLYETRDFGNTSLCIPCADNIADICGGAYSAAFYTRSSVKLTFNTNYQENICIKQIHQQSEWAYTKCAHTKGKCGNGMSFSDLSWTYITLCCALHNESYIIDETVDGFIINSRRYRVDVPVSNFDHGFLENLNQRKENYAYLGYIRNVNDELQLSFSLGTKFANHSLCLRNECQGNQEFQCLKKCAIQQLAIATVTGVDSTKVSKDSHVTVNTSTSKAMSNVDRYLTESRFSSSSMVKIVPGGHSSYSPMLSTFDVSTDEAPQKSENRSMGDSSTRIITMTKPKDVIEQKDGSKSLIVYVSVPVCVIAVLCVAIGVFIWRRKSKPEVKAAFSDRDKKQDDMEKAKELKGPTVPGIPEYAVVYKPNRDKHFTMCQPDDMMNKVMSEDDGHDEEYYVSNDEDYDHIRNGRKRNRSNSVENEYNVAGVGTLGNDIYSLAKPIDEDEQTEETYDASLSVHTDLINVTVDDTYDHSSPL